MSLIVKIFLKSFLDFPFVNWSDEIEDPMKIDIIENLIQKAKRIKEILNYSSLVLFLISLAFFIFKAGNAIINRSDHFPFGAAALFVIGSIMAFSFSNAELECDKLISKLEIVKSPSDIYQWVGLLAVSEKAQQLYYKLKALGRLPTVGEIEILTKLNFRDDILDIYLRKMDKYLS